MVSNSLEPALLGHKALELVPENKNTALGLATTAGLLLAVVWQPIVGGWSDRSAGRWGRRTPFLIAGTLIASAGLFSVAAAPVFGLVLVALLLTQLGTNTIQAPWQALVPDHVPAGQRGRAAGLKAMLEILGFILGRWFSGRLIAGGFVVGAAALPALGLAAALVITVLALRGRPEVPAAEGTPQTLPQGWRAALRGTLAVEWRANPGFRWWLLNRFLFWGGFIALNTFLLFFLIDVHSMPEARAQSFVADVSTLLGAAILAVTLPAGWLSDRIGRRGLVAWTGVAAAAGTAILLLARSTTGMIAAGVVLGLGVGGFLSADWALLTDLVPRAEAARYLGIANIAAAGGSATARLLGGVIIDPVSKLTGAAWAGYAAVFGIAMIGFLVATWAILRVPTGQGVKRSRESSAR
ncbi:MAG: MFS transporter [Anaerolineales bacterium]